MEDLERCMKEQDQKDKKASSNLLRRNIAHLETRRNSIPLYFEVNTRPCSIHEVDFLRIFREMFALLMTAYGNGGRGWTKL